MEIRPDSFDSAELAVFADALAAERQPLTLEGADGTQAPLPAALQLLLASVSNTMAIGNGVSVIPLRVELTEVEAADLLNISRVHLINQIEAGALPHHMVGTGRRLRLLDVFARRDQADAEADRALDAMAADGADLGLYE
jgi:excisionase family DNA binding protein